MKVHVTAKPNVKKAALKEIDATHLSISVQEPAEDDKANYAIIKVLARHFNVRQLDVRLIRGARSKQKTFIIA